tara:strand:- start:1 stop:111 length:111 start_codon:yes stop_codon:yes gene_type:complete
MEIVQEQTDYPNNKIVKMIGSTKSYLEVQSNKNKYS